MIVRCPVCATNYQVDARAIGPNGRMVRCAQCLHTWRQMLPADALVATADTAPRSAPPPQPAPDPPILPAAETAEEAPHLRGEFPEETTFAAAEESEPPPRRRHSGLVAIGWIVLVLVIAALAGAAVWQRKQVIALWPPSLKLYETLGLESVRASDGLVIHANPRRDDQNGVPRLVIEGEVINSATVALPVPQLQVELKDTSQHVVQTWTFTASTDRLLPGASVPFTTSVERPNEAATSMSVSFVDETHQ